tara:strand:+ start:3478 stop:4551 length:1074 start_codon:yes stop_codon:yes gene_type:complete
MKELIYKGPINSLSFGNVSFNLLREIFKKNIELAIFPIGNPDVSSFSPVEPSFKSWIEESINNRFKKVSAENHTLQLWHLNGSENRISRNQTLYSFYELDNPTETEKSLARLQDNLILSSSVSADMFGDNASYVPLGFDESFFNTGKTYLEGKIHFGIMGKLEKRKHTEKIIKNWIKKYGNNYNYQLTCCITNPFYKKEQMESAIAQITDRKSYGNVNFLPFMPKNSQVNDYLNSIDIDLGGMSGAEGWNLPSFNATCLGKWSIVLNCSAHKDWANEENCILLNPSGKEPVYDKIFFQEGSEFNQGNIYTFDDEEFINAMEEAEKVCKNINEKGKLLQKQFTYEKTLNSIIEIIKSK